MKYFTFEECIYSNTAIAKGIDNTPSAEYKAHIVESIEMLVDPLRESWELYCSSAGIGSPNIRISSGYRCQRLNIAVGGSSRSAHCYGYAFDLVPINGKIMDFKNFCREFLANCLFDQLISEGEDKSGTPSWMHIGYKSPRKEQRCQYLSMIKGKYYPLTK